MKKRIWLIAVVFIMLITGCKASKQNDFAGSEAYATGGGYATNEESIVEEDIEDEVKNETDPAKASEKLVYKANLEIQTLTFEDTLKEIRNQIKTYEGLIEYENEYTNNYYWYEDSQEDTMHIQMTVRIPTKNYENFLEDIGGSAKVISKSTEIINITKEYNDNSIRIEALESQQKRLLEMLQETTSIEEMMAIEAQRTNVESELNQLKSYQASMNTDIEYSTVSLSIDEVKKYTQNPTNFLSEVKERFKEGLEGFVEFFVDIILGIIYLMPFILLLGIIFFILKKTNHLPKLSFLKKKKDNIEKEEEHGKGERKV